MTLGSYDLLSQAVVWHSDHTPRAYEYSKMSTGQTALIRERWHDGYTTDWDYTFSTGELVCAWIGTTALLNCLFIFRSRGKRPGSVPSWDFSLAPAAIYIAQCPPQVTRTLRTSTRGLACTLEVLRGREMVRTLGQHVFLRFLGGGAGLRALGAHPRTIANVPGEADSGRTGEVVFRVRGGITRALSDMTTKGVAGRMLLDSPYGWPPPLGNCDRVCLLAFGTGAPPSSPARSRREHPPCFRGHVHASDPQVSPSSLSSPCVTSVSSTMLLSGVPLTFLQTRDA
ncbi:hypothetical protein PHLGIDRAFT_160510 [Phlebiopsis gigantea 11061_1 CR5-6]|uniref:FAD-binding FR-type domain-containing protein n=1 Tax=Phlebiopsis gigantea (strain 11061_1 CR5-6) TaxID=745531 RepID=A0A0C3RVI5_PHLG1|nr:hypothetical protein PHLGIDRAFT_160510 [Phlebiopsis gigantea 11061_1 CR5-6]